MLPALVIHGGAWAIPDAEVGPHQAGLDQALDAGWEVLTSKGTALDACTAAVEVMERDQTFDAGVGSFLNTAGQVELDAGIMDGATLNAGCVAAVRRVRDPLRLACHVLDSWEVMLVGQGAEQFALERGMELCEPESLVVERERRRWERLNQGGDFDQRTAFTPGGAPNDTVGAVALDHLGRLASASSTGGPPRKRPGRVGDTPIVGAGLYADDRMGACCCTGLGEDILRVGLARLCCQLLHQELSPQEAAESGIAALKERVGGLGGCILLDPKGRVGVAFNTARMAFGYCLASGERRAKVGEFEDSMGG